MKIITGPSKSNVQAHIPREQTDIATKTINRLIFVYFDYNFFLSANAPLPSSVVTQFQPQPYQQQQNLQSDVTLRERQQQQQQQQQELQRQRRLEQQKQDFEQQQKTEQQIKQNQHQQQQPQQQLQNFSIASTPALIVCEKITFSSICFNFFLFLAHNSN
jgi:hypothetical protein